jgi:hypothetical protein
MPSKKSDAKAPPKAAVSKKPEAKVEEIKQFAHPEGYKKCTNCELYLPPRTGTCPSCGYRQPHPGWD